MKQVVPNLTDVLTSRYIANLARLRKFVRYWGTTTVDGIEVFTYRKHFYPDMDASTEKLAKFLNVYNDVKVKPEGVRSSWFYLNPRKAKDTDIVWNKQTLANNFNKALTKLLSCSLIIGPKLVKKKQVPADIVTPVIDQAGIIAEIRSKYEGLWSSGHTFFSSEDDPYLALLTMYILKSTTIPYEIVAVEETVSSTYRPTAETMDGVNKTDQVKAWRIRLNIPVFIFTAATDIINSIAADVNSDSATVNLQIKERLFTSTVETTPEDGSDEDKPDTVYESMPTTTSSFWHTSTTGPGIDIKTVTYLKASIVTTTALTTSQKLAYIFSCLDTGFLKKKRKWYEIVIAFIIIIVSIIYAQPAGVAAGVAAGTGAAVTSVIIVAVTITVAALYISLAALALSYMGAQNVASALGQFLKTVAPLVQVASVIAIIASIYSLVRRGVQQAATEAARRGAEATTTSIATNIASSVVEAFTGLTKLTSLTMAHIAKMLSFTFDIYQNMANRDLQREISNYRREIATISESKEKSETSDIVKELMASYPNPLSNDWSYYSEIYDRPYEWWSTPYHTGNIQATTVNALWLNDPQNAILYNNSTGDS